MTDEQLSLYDQAVDHFIAGRWDEAYRLLHLMPAGDRGQDFLSVLIGSTIAFRRPTGTELCGCRTNEGKGTRKHASGAPR